jgi:hypothetical protein
VTVPAVKRKVKGKVVVFNQAPHLEDVSCLIKHHSMETYLLLN